MSSANEFFESADQVGQLWTKIGLIVAVVIGIVLVISGLMIYMKKDVYTKTSQGKVVEIKRIVKTTSDVVTSVKIAFDVGEETHHLETHITGSLSIGDEVTIEYNPENPEELCRINVGQANKQAGVAMIISALFMVLIAYIYYWATRKSQFLSKLVGAKRVGMLI